MLGHFAGGASAATGHAGGVLLNPLAKATWSLLNRTTGEIAPGVVSGAGTMGWVFDSTGTLRERPHNVVLWSEQFSNAAWGKTQTFISADTVAAPIGATSASKLVETATSGGHELTQYPAFSGQAGTSFTISLYARAAERNSFTIQTDAAGFGTQNCVFNLASATVGVPGGGASSPQIQAVGNGWFRCSLVVTATGSFTAVGVKIRMRDNSGPNYQGDGASGFFIWGAQLNRGALQPYYSTTGAPFFGPRVSWDPSNLAAGPFMPTRPARTNRIRNNTGQGVVTGILGTPPNFWNISGASNGLQREILGMFTVAGMPMLRLRIFGTATATSAFSIWAEGTVGQVTATPGQLVTNSLFTRVVAGGTTGLRMGVQEFDSASAFLRGPELPVAVSGSLTRHLQPVTIGANTASVRSGCFVAYTNGQVVDVTLDIGVPELSDGDILPWEPPILTYGAPATVGADNVNLPSAGIWPAGGATLFVDADDTLTPSGATRRFLQLDDLGSLNRIILGKPATNSSRLLVQTSGASVADLQTTVTAGARTKMAARVVPGSQAQATNGALTATATAPTLPVVNTLRIGSSDANDNTTASGTRVWQAHIIPGAVSDSGLRRMVR